MISTQLPVLVTGASGYIATHLVRDLLDKGYKVRGTVRDPKKAEVLRKLPGAERLELVSADLLDAASLAAAAKGCEYVMHTASPYVLTVKDAQKDLVDPAVKGTEHALEACAAAGVKRVVLTSSCAAIAQQAGDRPFTEADWNDDSSLDFMPYYYSKTVAERAAWKFVEMRKPSFDLVTIHPSVVLGPSLIPALNTSVSIVSDLVNGKQPATVRLEWGIIDVRDVARAHVLAMETQTAKGRYICSAGSLTMPALVTLLRAQGVRRLPKLSLAHPVGDVVAKLFALTQPSGARQYIRSNVGPKRLAYDNTKIQRELGLKFRSIEDTVRETVTDLRRWGHVKAA